MSREDLAPKNNEKEKKPNLSLLPFDVLKEDALAYEYGIFKYKQYSWMEGFITSELIASALRHIANYFWDGEKYDDEALQDGFKMHHLSSARFCLASIMHAEIEGLGVDDRPFYKLKECREKTKARRLAKTKTKKEETFQCRCGGSIVKINNVWECDSCSYSKEEIKPINNITLNQDKGLSELELTLCVNLSSNSGIPLNKLTKFILKEKQKEQNDN